MKGVSNTEGNYYLYNKKGKRIYAGHSRVLRHRLQSYIEKDMFDVHPTKKKLRNDAYCFTVTYRPVEDARAIERRIKKGLPYNYK